MGDVGCTVGGSIGELTLFSEPSFSIRSTKIELGQQRPASPPIADHLNAECEGKLRVAFDRLPEEIAQALGLWPVDTGDASVGTHVNAIDSVPNKLQGANLGEGVPRPRRQARLACNRFFSRARDGVYAE